MMAGPPYPRRPTPQVYRLRRAAVATVLVLVVFVGWKVVGGGGGRSAGRTTTTSSATTTTLPKVPACTTGEQATTQNPLTEWNSIVVDSNIALPATYGPPDLHNISDAGFPFTAGLALRSFVMKDLSAFRQAAAVNGTPLKILAAYRSYQTQQQLYATRTNQVGNSESGSRVDRPGHSEHQLGTTIDVTSDALATVDQTWGATPTGQWVASNAYKYGFVMSYPNGASASTCFDFEPWHLRYVGQGEAAAVIQAGVTLRQYLYGLLPNGGQPAATDTSSTSGTSSTTSAGP
jgi:D-alanyl-D-alanine carboxypeptidase